MYPPGLPPPTTPTTPKSGRGLTIVLAIALVAVIGVGIVLVSSARSDTDSVQTKLDTLNHKLKITQQAAGTDQSSASDAADQLTALTKKEADDQKMITDQQANIASLQQQVGAKTASVAQLTDQLNRAQSDATANKTAADTANAALTTAKANLGKAQADLIKAQSDLTAAQANATALGTPFVVDVTLIRPPTKDFSVTGSKVACNGFTDPATACPDNQTLSGHINNDAGKLTLEVPGFVLVPLASFDGFNYVGSAPVANGSGFTCGSVSNTTTMNVIISPTHYTVGAKDQSVIATSLSVTWTLSSPAGACVASTYTYHGFFDYS